MGMRQKARAMASQAGLSQSERFLFDLNGFLVVRGVFSAEEVAAANAAIDSHAAKMMPRDAEALRNARAATPFSAQGPRLDMGGMLQWPKPDCEFFRNVLTHPRLVPYYTALCGEGYRLDHQPLVIAQGRDSEGFSLHGGPLGSRGELNPELQYRCWNGEFWNSLLGASVQLVDHNAGDGGFCVIRGSHKLNLAVPDSFANALDPAFADHAYQPVTKAGDVVIFSEATVHGATPWRSDRQRRIALYRFSPANMGYGRGYLEVPQSVLEDMTPLQRAVLAPPYSTRLERPVVTPESAERDAVQPGGEASFKARSGPKKELDRAIFGTTYF